MSTIRELPKRSRDWQARAPLPMANAPFSMSLRRRLRLAVELRGKEPEKFVALLDSYSKSTSESLQMERAYRSYCARVDADSSVRPIAAGEPIGVAPPPGDEPAAIIPFPGRRPFQESPNRVGSGPLIALVSLVPLWMASCGVIYIMVRYVGHALGWWR